MLAWSLDIPFTKVFVFFWLNLCGENLISYFCRLFQGYLKFGNFILHHQKNIQGYSGVRNGYFAEI